MSEPTYTIAADGGSITCHRCGLTSYHPMDVAHRYCGACHRFHTDAEVVAIDLDTLRARMQGDKITENDIDLLFALLTVERKRGDTAEFKAMILQAQLGGWAAACAAQVAVLQDVQSYLHGASSDVDTLKRRIEEATETNAGELLLTRLQQAEAVIGTLREWMLGEVSGSALNVALAQYDAATKARPE